MTIREGKYPNKEDYNLNRTREGIGKVDPDELPLADPSQSDVTNELTYKVTELNGEHRPSAYSDNKMNRKS
ncbi:hypothetical protein ACXYMX_11375 [Sporosarcina sp. CAU 1771]